MTMTLKISTISSPVGLIQLTIKNNHLTQLNILANEKNNDIAESPHPIISALNEYFADPKYTFNLPLQPAGSAFQQRVWQALQKIPTGAVLTYGELAKQLKTSPRAIGQACRTNPIPIVIPCHRIVAANHVGGYSGKREGEMLVIKCWLLKHEGVLPSLKS